MSFRQNEGNINGDIFLLWLSRKENRFREILEKNNKLRCHKNKFVGALL